MESATLFQLDDAERARTVDFARRMRTVRNPALAFLVPSTLLGIFTYGPLVLPFVVLLVVAFWGLGYALPRSGRPELLLVATLVWCQANLVGMMMVADAYGLDALGLLILPAAAACMLFPRRMMVAFTLWSVVVMVGAAFAIDAAQLRDAPPALVLPLGVMLCVALPGAMIRQLEIDSRDTAMIDTLTGALNRSALEIRVAELSAQAHTLPLRVGVIMSDLDRFKLVNDELGHDAGDAVLKETVRRMRTILGPLTPVYRVGGEEFAVLMAGADESQVAAVAERLREAVRGDAIHGRMVTMSFGIAAATLDQHSVPRLIEVADEALYRAKRAGRDRVSAASLTPMSVVQAPADVPSAPAVSDAGDGPDLPTDQIASAPAAVALGHDHGNWLVRGDFERDHIRESASALARTHHGALGFVFLALVASIPWIGWRLMVPAAFAVIAYHGAERLIKQIKRPEYVLGGTWLGVQLSIFAGALIAAPAEPYMLVLFSPMMIGMTAVFPSRGVVVNSAISIVLVVVGGALARPDLLTAAPGVIAPPILILVGLALMSSVTGRSAIEFRTKAVVDPLTGLLTRAALQTRLAEIGQESQVAGARVSVVAFDVDDFKGLNDAHGHVTGDAVLRSVGVATRGHLHALEWGFRLGGDEFVIVVPSGQEEASRLAERLRAALAAIDVDGVRLTGSFGVAASGIGERFDFESVMRRADAALYEAKRAGRNRVAVASVVAPGPAPVATVLRGVA